MHYQDDLQALEARALDGLDLVVEALDRTIEAVQHQDMELAGIVVANDDVLGRPLPRGAPAPAHDARHAGARSRPISA